MKWIGQHIWPFKSRMRNDVIVEKESSLYMGTNEVISQSGGNVTLANINAIDSGTATVLAAAVPSVNIDALDPLGGTGLHQTQDHFLFSDNGTEKKITFSNLEDAIFGHIGGDGAVAAAGALTLSEAQVNMQTIYNDELMIGANDDKRIDFSQDGMIALKVGGNDRLGIYDGSISPINNNVLDVGTIDTNFKDGFFAGAVRATLGFAGPLTGNATTATSLVTSRNFQADLASTSAAAFTGAANCTLGVTGTLAVGNGGTGLTSLSTLLNSNVTSVSGSSGTVTSIGNLTGDVTSVNRATTLAATQPNIESIGTSGDTLNILSNKLSMVNSTQAYPLIGLTSTHNSLTGPHISMTNQRTDGGGNILASNDDDYCGTINMLGYDNASTPEGFRVAAVDGKIADREENAVAGELNLRVAEYDGTLTSGLKLDGDTNADGEIDVTIGAGAASTTTIAGTLTMGSTATLDNSGVVKVASQPDITTLAALQNVGSVSGAEATLNYIGATIQMKHSDSQYPILSMINETNDALSGSLGFYNKRGTAGGTIGQIGDVCGSVYFYGHDTTVSPVKTLYASIDAKIDVPTNGQESGKLSLSVANYDSGMGDGLILTGGNVNDEIDVTVGLGAASVTTIAGTLTTGSTAALNNTGEIQVASQPNITTLAGVTTIGATGVNTLISSDDVQFYNPVDNGSPIYSFGASNNERFTIYPIYDSGAQTLDKVSLNTSVASGTAHKGKFVIGVDDVHILTIDDDGLNFESGKVLTGDVTGDLTGDVTGNADTATSHRGTRHHGTKIKILPSDWIQDEGGGVNKSEQFVSGSWSGTYGVRATSTDAELWAFIPIPEGMKVTHTYIYGTETPVVNVYSYSLEDGSLTAPLSGAGNVGTELNHGDVSSTASNCFAIRVVIDDISGSGIETIYGGYLTIAAI